MKLISCSPACEWPRPRRYCTCMASYRLEPSKPAPSAKAPNSIWQSTCPRICSEQQSISRTPRWLHRPQTLLILFAFPLSPHPALPCSRHRPCIHSCGACCTLTPYSTPALHPNHSTVGAPQAHPSPAITEVPLGPAPRCIQGCFLVSPHLVVQHGRRVGAAVAHQVLTDDDNGHTWARRRSMRT